MAALKTNSSLMVKSCFPVTIPTDSKLKPQAMVKNQRQKLLADQATKGAYHEH
jgi:hypothetical protein